MATSIAAGETSAPNSATDSSSVIASSSTTHATTASSSPPASMTIAELDPQDADVPLSTSPRLVRFDERCVLIPGAGPARTPGRGGAPLQPHIATLDVTVPIPTIPWRRVSVSPTRKRSGGAHEELGEGQGEAEPAPRGNNVVLKVPFPVFRRRSHSNVQNTSENTLTPCLVQRDSCGPPPSPSASSSSALTTPSPEKRSRRRQVRSASLPLYSAALKVETVPLRPCCTKCLTACDKSHWLPSLKESSREQSPVRGRNMSATAEEDWCTGLHFTKGALKLRRSASSGEHGAHSESEGAALLGTLVRVDEVDLKRGSSASSSPRGSLSESRRKRSPERAGAPRLCTHALDRVKGTSKGSESSTPSDDSEEDLFPLPSPKRSPAASPADSATYLPGLLGTNGGLSPPVAEPRKLEAAIRAKMAARERFQTGLTFVSKTSPITIPTSSRSPSSPTSRRTLGSAPVVSHFRSHLDEIAFDPASPEPDALPPDLEILLNSPPGSPGFPRAFGQETSASSVQLSESEKYQPPAASKETVSTSTSVSTASAPNSADPAQPHQRARRRASFTQIMRAGVGVLRGIVPASQSSPGIGTYRGGMVV